MGRGDLLVDMLTCWHFLFLLVRSKSSNITRSDWVVGLKVCLPRKDNYHFFNRLCGERYLFMGFGGGDIGCEGGGSKGRKKKGKKINI